MSRARLLIGWPATDADLFAATRLKSPRCAALLEIASERIAFVEPSEFELAAAVSPTADVISAPVSAWLGAPCPVPREEAVSWLLEFLRARGVRSLEVPFDFPHGCAQGLALAGIEVATVGRPFFTERSRKSAEEIDALRRIARTLTAALVHAQERLTACEIVGARLFADGSALDAEALAAELDRFLLAQEIDAPRVIVSCGPSTATPHVPGEGPLRAGQPILIDLFGRCRSTWLWGDVARTFVRGEPDPLVQRAHEALGEARRAALAALRPGQPIAGVHLAAERELARAGFETRLDDDPPTGFLHACGHGVGYELHEPPFLGPVDGSPALDPARRAENEKPEAERDVPHLLEEGQVLAIEPGVTLGGRGAVRHEAMVLLGSDGPQLLALEEWRFRL